LASLTDPERIPAATADALDLQLHGVQDPERQVFDYLRRKQMLLHFDNFEHLVEGNGFVTELLRHAPRVTVLVTSRERLGLAGELVFRLDSLPTGNGNGVWTPHSYSAASRLFANRATLVNPQFVLDDQTARAVETICNDLEGVPLAIELAAAWTDQYELSELHRELHWQIDLASKSPDVPERHRSVRASCDWSFQLLNEGQRLLLRSVAMFAGGFFLETARQLLPLPDIADELDALVRKSWLRTSMVLGRTRFEMHNSAIREYAFQQLLGSDDYELTVNTHCRIFGQFIAEQARELKSERQIEATRRIALELENLIEASRTAVARDQPDLIVPLVDNLHEFLLLVGGAWECLARYREFLAKGRELEHREIVIGSLLALAAAHIETGDYELARALAGEAGGVLDQTDANADRARCAEILAVVDKFEGNHAESRYQYNLALSLLRDLADRHGVAAVLHGLGQVEMIESNFETARSLIGESVALRREIGDAHGVASCLSDLGNMEYRQGHFPEARELHSESLAIRRSLGDRRGIGQSLSNLGNVEFSECDYGAAWSLYSESLAIRQEIGERFGIAASLNNLGNVQYCEGNLEEARRLHEDGLEIKREIGDRIGVSYSLNNLGNISIRLEDFPAAREQLSEALLIARELNSVVCLIAALANCSCLIALRGSARPARILYWAVHNMLEAEQQALDPMDSGMLEEGGKQALSRIAPAEDPDLQEEARRLSYEQLVALALKEL
ncbi:MAG TPA: tetratricopeptide repeat protein, partial [Firmicutes bacterium]|nr:tetratricopeptide repeat protein [Bacillota bacterium]